MQMITKEGGQKVGRGKKGIGRVYSHTGVYTCGNDYLYKMTVYVGKYDISGYNLLFLFRISFDLLFSYFW